MGFHRNFQVCGIEYIINLSVNCPQPDHFKDDEHFLRIPVNDSYQDKLLPYFEEAFKFLGKNYTTEIFTTIGCLFIQN